MALARAFLGTFAAPRMRPLPRGAVPAAAAAHTPAAAPLTLDAARRLFSMDFERRDALKDTRGVVNALSMGDVAWELGYELGAAPDAAAEYRRLFARYEPLAASLGVNLRERWAAGAAAA